MENLKMKRAKYYVCLSCVALVGCSGGKDSEQDQKQDPQHETNGEDTVREDSDGTTAGSGEGTGGNGSGTDATGNGKLALDCPASAEVSRLAKVSVKGVDTSGASKLQWSLTHPDGSSGKLKQLSPSEVSFTPDLPGAYRVRVSTGTGSAALAECSVTVVGTPPKVPISISNPSDQAVADAPFTFGQPFKKGAYPGTQAFELQIEGKVDPIQLQTDIKALHPDGSLRHAIFSGRTGALSAKEVLQAKIAPVEVNASSSSLDRAKVIAQTKDLVVKIVSEGQTYSLSLHQVFGDSPEKLWLDGAQAKEWHVQAAPKTSAGVEHPHLYLVFNLRVYADGAFAMVDVAVENSWTYQASPKNHLYDVTVEVGGNVVFDQKSLYHLRRARWKKRFWLQENVPQVHVAHDATYLMATKSVPNYEANLVGGISDKLLERYRTRWKPTVVTKALDDKGNRVDPGSGAFEFSYDNYGPMGTGLAQAQMGTTGGRPDIGPLPRWVTSYLLNQDPLSKKVALGMADLAGTWPMHFRDKKTGMILSIDDYPYASVLWNQGTTLNPDTGKREGPTPCEEQNKAHCAGYHTPDSAHQPAFAYVPYLLTGDYFYLEELHFWANYNFLTMNPSYRGTTKGLFTSQQDRGQAWSLRTLGHTAYITPDGHPLKSYFKKRLDLNLAEYKKRYVDNPPNQYGALKPNYSFPTASPWMDDFFTWAMGALVDLGYEDARSIHAWKSRFPVQRMGFGAEEAKSYCWILGSAYQLRIAQAKGEAMYQTIDEVYRMNNAVEDHRGTINIDDKGLPCASQAQADAKGIHFEEMIGYGRLPAGFPSNMRPALATAADSGIPGAKEAWKRFFERKAKPDYREYPVWAVVPRTYEP